MEFATRQNITTVVHKKTNSFFQKKAEPTFFSPVLIQPKLTIGPADDPYEREADSVADKVMRMPDNPAHSALFSGGGSINTIQRRCATCEEEDNLQRKDDKEKEFVQTKPDKRFNIKRKCSTCEEGEMVQPKLHLQRKCAECEEKEKILRKESVPNANPEVTPAVQQTLNSPGHSLDKQTRSFMESRFGYDFSHVRVHNDVLAHTSSKDINALAYAHGDHVVFGAGQYQPHTNAGKQLLAHELAHVVQQRSMRAKTIQGKVIDDDKHVTCRPMRPGVVAELITAEEEAARMADNAALALRRNPISESTRESLWKHFKMDYNKMAYRCRFVPGIADRFENVANGIRNKVITYGCTDNTGEPHPGCSSNPPPVAITRSGLFAGHDILLCLWFWKKNPYEKAVVLLHEWVHFLYQHQGTFDELPGGFDTAGCYHAFAIDANNGKGTGHEEANCTPNSHTELPPLNKAAVEKVPCPANIFLNISALAGTSSLQDSRFLTTEIGLDYLLPISQMHEWELSIGGRFTHLKPSKPEDQAAMAVGARVGLTYRHQPWRFGRQYGTYIEGGAINATDRTGKESTIPYLGIGGTAGINFTLGERSSMQIFVDVGKRYGLNTGDSGQLKWFHAGIGVAFQVQ